MIIRKVSAPFKGFCQQCKKRTSRGDVLQKFLKSLYLLDGKIDMNKFISFVQSK